MKNNVQDRDRWDMASEQMKYAEVQAVAGGVTAVQGSPALEPMHGTACYQGISNCVISVKTESAPVQYVEDSSDDDYTGNHLISQNQSGSLNANGSYTFQKA